MYPTLPDRSANRAGAGDYPLQQPMRDAQWSIPAFSSPSPPGNMPALAHLRALSTKEQESLAAQLPRCTQIAARLPLVRVIVPEHDRHLTEIHDFFADGLLLRSHKSTRSRNLEQQLGAGDGLYFHAGRSHPVYGLAILVLTEISEPVEVTPFGLGGLCCPNNASSTLHTDGGCVSPVAHRSEAEQRRFVQESTWRADWRAYLAAYIAYYYDSEPSRYFADGESSRPARIDPDGIFADLSNRDWRIWTAEVRVQADLRFQDPAMQGTLLFWGAHPMVEQKLKRDAVTRKIRLSTLYPTWLQLPRAKRLPVESVPGTIRFAAIQTAIISYVL